MTKKRILSHFLNALAHQLDHTKIHQTTPLEYRTNIVCTSADNIVQMTSNFALPVQFLTVKRSNEPRISRK